MLLRRGAGSHARSQGLPWMNVHQQHQRLHRYHVDAFTVKSGHFQHFQVGDAQHDQREQEGERVQSDGENHELHLGSLRAGAAEGARRVKGVVADPGATGGHGGEAEGVDPGVSQRHHRVPVPDSGVVAEREHHGHPSVDAECCHAQHGIGGEEGVEETHNLTEAAGPGVAGGDQPGQSQGHVGHALQQVAERQVESEKPGYLFADLGVIQEADQNDNVGQQRHQNYPQNEHRSNKAHCVHRAK